MGITIGSNIASLAAQRQLAGATEKGGKVLLRLSSGMRINQASDDPAGLAVSSTLSASARVLGKALTNVNDGISLINVAEAALQQLQDISMRQRELAAQAANGSYTLAQRQALYAESNALSAEFGRIIGSTSFNGKMLLSDPSNRIGVQSGTGSAGNIDITLGAGLARNAGDGTFDPYVTFAAPIGLFTGLAAGDFNNDGRPDMVSMNFGGPQGANVFLNTGGRTFSGPVVYNTGTQPSSVAIGDLNGDGNQDLVTGNTNSDNLSVLLGNGDGTFQPQTVLALGVNPGAVNIGDINNDGKPDIVLGTAGGTYRYLGNGNGTFQAGVVLTAATGEVRLADFNSDGRLDLMQNSPTAGGHALLYGNGDGTFRAGQTIMGVNGYGSIAAAGDFNRDGRLDFAMANGEWYAGNIEVFTQKTDGTFAMKVYTAPNNNGAYVNTADFNGDGILDLMSTGQMTGGLSVLLGNSDGTFADALTATAPVGVHQPISADFDGDGRADIGMPQQGAANAMVFWARGGQTTSAQYHNLTTREGALAAMSAIDATMERIRSELANLGAASSRFQAAIDTLQATRENYLTAASRITDADMAEESASLARFAVLQQAGAAVLAQANQQPSVALELLAGV